jgi:ABC-type amino acid transport substrate-binding protein
MRANRGWNGRWTAGMLAAFAMLVSVLLGGTFAAGKLDELQKAGVVHAGWATFKPLIYTDTGTGKVTGFWGDITQEMATEGLHVKVEWVEGTWATIVTGIQAGKWDVAPAGITESRSEVALATKPFAKVDYTMLVKDKSPAKSWKDLDQAGKRISVSQGSNTDQALTKVVKQATIVRVHQEQALLEVLGDKVDGQAVQRDYAMQAIKKYPGLRTVPDAFGSSFIGWYVPKGADDLRTAIDEWLDGAKKRGVVRQLLDKWNLEGAEPA